MKLLTDQKVGDSSPSKRTKRLCVIGWFVFL